MPNKNTTLLYSLIFIALVGYVLPWIVTPTAPLTLGAYDLAEWASLHPSQPLTTPIVLIVPLLLRVQLLICAVLIGGYAHGKTQQVIAIISILILAVAQLPPLEFITQDMGNINYQQQFALAFGSLVIGVFFTFIKRGALIALISIVLICVGIVTAYTGLQQSQELYLMSLQENSSGMGIVVMCLAYLAIGIVNLVHVYKIKQGS